MPLYEYDCMSCAQRLVKERSIKDVEPSYFCKNCNNKLVRVYSSFGTIFNGNGFYSTDNRK